MRSQIALHLSRLGATALTGLYALFGAGLAHSAGLPIISPQSDAKYTMSRYTTLPVTSVDTATPQALIQMAKDHQLFFKAYNDYTDLNRNGVIDPQEITYNHGFDYYGYFDSYKCYVHAASISGTGLAGFTPVAGTGGDQDTLQSADSATNRSAKYCAANSGQWSGNFLNWATMTRIDVLRKILFGGKRVVDDSLTIGAQQLTILERQYLPNDAHSFAKHYLGPDIARLTPFNPPISGANPQDFGLTICNTTVDTGFSLLSNDVTAAPRMRVASGNALLWAANERWQCLWREEALVVPTNTGSAADNPPVGRAASNSNDPAASGIPAMPNSPSRASRALGTGIAAGDYAVRVQVCAAGQEVGDRCKQYADGTHKPIGLLQEFGDTDRLLFGLVAGTYSKNKGGGDVMKNVASITNEVNVRGDPPNNRLGDGRFILTKGLKDETGAVVTTPKAADMINGLSLYRIIKYQHNNGTYGTNGNNVNNCTFALDGFADGTCQNWGNPFGEGFLAALRYFGGQPPAGAFRSNDSNEIPGLNPPQAYKYSIDETNACADLSIVAFNNSSISYDGDDLDSNAAGIGSLGATLSSSQLTDVVGAGEGLHGRTFFVGENGANNNQTCTAKTVNSLGAVRGICPDAPRVEGTFRIAGLAHYAHTTGIDNKDTRQKHTVKTYGVNMASSTPVLDVPVPGGGGRKVTLLPACQNLDLTPAGRVGACGLVDFKIVEAHTEVGGVGTGKFYVNWEDGEQGGDFDQDIWGTLSYRIDSTSITITTDTFAVSTPYRMGFGFVVNGTTQDGFHAYSGARGYSYADGTGVLACSNCQVADGPASHQFTIGNSTAEQLKDPLWYAAKWGGFKDSNGNNVPDLQSEWDKSDADGNAIPDGVPDNYFYAVEPRQLEAQLRRVFSEISGRVASGTAAAVVANAREGEGALYQALFEPRRADSAGREVNWIGSLHSLWVDATGQLREDGNGNAVLDGYGSDPVVELYFDDNVDPARTRVRRYSGDPQDAATTTTVVEVTDLRPIWNARDRLAALTNAQAETQRAYNTPASSGRHILTHIDLNQNGIVDANETVAFSPSSFGNGRFGILNSPDVRSAEALVKYVRGNDTPTVAGPGPAIPRLRSRVLDYDENGSPETMRLADIVNSSPTLVAQPAEAYDLLYDDDTYRVFRERYRNRRQVVYVGSNGGMLHAFNAGFFDPQNKAFRTALSGETPHPLGSELWGYVPYSLLPHLTWLTDTDYSHVTYIDARPRAFDMRVYNTGCNDARNPCGWATLLVVGLRFGGGDIGLPIKATNNGPLTAGFSSFSGFANNQRSLKTGSAYIVLDVTDPEAPPRVLGELKPTDIGFTTSFPTGIAHSARGNTPTNLAGRVGSESWHLIFGNGPNNLDTGIAGVANNLIDARSNRSGKVYVVDMKALASGSANVYRGTAGSTNNLSVGTAPTLPATTVHFNLGNTASNSFVGDPVTSDWDLDFKANQVYFSSVGGTPNESGNGSGPLGRLFKFDLSTYNATSKTDDEQASPANWIAPKLMLDPGVPGISTPSLTFDEFGRRWVFASTGRLFGDPDKSSIKQQYVFGVIDSRLETAAAGSPMYNFGNLVDVSNAQVTTTGAVSGVAGATTETQLVQLVAGDGDNDGFPDRGGWKMNLALTPLAAERSVTSTALLGDILFATAFTPSSDLCGGLGSSRLYGLYFKTGAPRAGLPTFGTDTVVVNNVSVDVARRDISAGSGLASSPSLQLSGARDQRGLTIFTQTSTGSIERREGVIDEGARSGEMDWRERY